MDSRSKKEMCLGVDSDMLSNLPENVTDQILIRLPIRDAVRTSVLSTKWRYKWTTIPQLVFHDKLVLPSSHENKDKLFNLIDRVLLSHSGFIHKFELSTRWLPISCTINCWVLFLSRRNIKEFVLKFLVSSDERYKLPDCFFSAQQICSLELHGCVLKPPPTFTGFSNLKSLYLNKTRFDSGGFECLISKISVLERLTWKFFDHVDHLNVCCPSLRYLCLCGSFEDISFENTPLLYHVSIALVKFKKFLPSETGNVVKVLKSLPTLRKLVVHHHFLEFLILSKIPEKLPFTCHHLNSLSLGLNFECVNEICVTLCLLNSSPNLRKLEILYCPGSEKHNIENFWEERARVDWNMHGPQAVKILDFKGFELELEFIKLLLANSPKLEMLRMEAQRNCDSLKFLKQLVSFQRASPKAVIKFLEPDDQ